MTDLIYKEESYIVTGICMEVYNELGPGLLEIIYKEAIEYELAEREIYYEREKPFTVKYKTITLSRSFNADFTVYNKIILEVKAKEAFSNDDIAQTINYLKLSGYKLALLINFGKTKLEVKRLVL
ncbi:MAG TPA: GxxExxY protein [Ferruginibacter sp.]|nr:GxxExxY protein [Ferruginibacter sp.]